MFQRVNVFLLFEWFLRSAVSIHQKKYFLSSEFLLQQKKDDSKNYWQTQPPHELRAVAALKLQSLFQKARKQFLSAPKLFSHSRLLPESEYS
ncbi:MAG TPA: hypothetical protein DCQ93_06230 [Bacteroidetes bacterium]|nr:hypothetical protein [Bacteroidota bacterium]